MKGLIDGGVKVDGFGVAIAIGSSSRKRFPPPYKANAKLFANNIPQTHLDFPFLQQTNQPLPRFFNCSIQSCHAYPYPEPVNPSLSLMLGKFIFLVLKYVAVYFFFTFI